MIGIANNKITQYVTNLATYFGASLIPMLLSLASNPWIAKNMSPEDYAISGYYTSFSTLLSPIILFYMVHYYIKEYFKKDDDGREGLFNMIAKGTIWFSGIVSLVCLIMMFIYLKYLNSSLSLPIFPYLSLMVFSLPLTGLLQLQLAKYRMEKDSRSFFILSVSNGTLNILLSLCFVVFIKWGAFGKLLAPLLCNGIVFLYLFIKYRSLLMTKVSFADFKPIVVFCTPLALSATLGYFSNGFSTTYLESIGNNTEYGIYVVGASIGAYLTVFSTAIGNTFQPDLYESVIKKQWKRYMCVIGLEIGITSVICLCFIALAPYIIAILTANRYNASTPYAQIIAVSTVSSCIYFLMNQYCIATERPKLYLYTTILGSIGIIALMPYAVDRWEYYGGAWMAVMSYIILAAVNIMLLGLSRLKILPDKIWK